jgi:hypothetical protein
MRARAIVYFAALLFAPISWADYAEECAHEGCSDEEVRELYDSYKEECINEGCSKEEIIELAGRPEQVNAMLAHFRKLGLKVREEDLPAGDCAATGTVTKCAAVLLMCKDYYQCPTGKPDLCREGDFFCPGGNETSSWYVCGACLGFDWF